MEELSLYVLDITMNSVRAGADKIEIRLEEKDGILTFSVTDNGCGMTREQLEHLKDPFYTTRKTRAVGLGVPFLTLLSEQTGGHVTVESKDATHFPKNHGTCITATFGINHIDFIPLGDMVGTVVTLIQGSPDVDFTFDHITSQSCVHLSCREIRDVLGDEISLASYEVLAWIRESLEEEYSSLKH